jgi:hypothetical protein
MTTDAIHQDEPTPAGCPDCGTYGINHDPACAYALDDDSAYPDPGYPVSAEQAAWEAAEAARGPLAGCPDTLDCYECGGFDGVSFVEQPVMKRGPVGGGSDPTQLYVLACGHLTF